MKNNRDTIAVVEDDEGLRTALQQLLRSAGFGATTFGSAEDFLANANRAELGCVIADINLPGITGVELVKRLGSNGDRVPAVLMTGRRDAATAELASQLANVPRLCKPFSDDALFDVLAHVMNR
jgi:FixJ family two-component response regulator